MLSDLWIKRGKSNHILSIQIHTQKRTLFSQARSHKIRENYYKLFATTTRSSFVIEISLLVLYVHVSVLGESLDHTWSWVHVPWAQSAHTGAGSSNSEL